MCPADDDDEANFVVANIEAWWAAVARGEPPEWTAWARAHPLPTWGPHKPHKHGRPKAEAK